MEQDPHQLSASGESAIPNNIALSDCPLLALPKPLHPTQHQRQPSSLITVTASLNRLRARTNHAGPVSWTASCFPKQPWRVAPIYTQQPAHTENFIRNIKTELLDPRLVVMVTDEIFNFLEQMPVEQWDVTRDIPACKPLGDMVFWEWRDHVGVQVGAMCKAVIKRTLTDAITEFETSQAQHFDYDVALVLDSAQKATATITASEANAPVVFLTGTIMVSVPPAPNPKSPLEPMVEVRPLGSFALTMRADCRPVPDSLSLMLWDDETSHDAMYSPRQVKQSLELALTDLLLMHTMMRAPEVKSHRIEGSVYENRKSKMDGAGLAGYYHVEMGTLPTKLRSEGFADQDGLKKALFYMTGRFVQPPIVWRD